MDKKRKNDLPTPVPERVREFEGTEGTEGRKKMRKTNTEELDFFSDGTDGKEKQLQDLAVKEVDHSEGNMKGKIRPGAKRTKKPPKSLENFICRPSVRVFQRPEPVGQSVCKRRDGISAKTKRLSQLCHPVQKKCNTDSLETKDNSAMTNTDSSALSLSSLIPSSIISPASDSSTTRAAKKVLPKQTKKTDLKSDITLQETPQSSNKLSISHKITLNSNIKQTYSSKNPPDSNSTYQRESSPHECINVLDEDMKQKGQASPNSSYGNPSETSLHAVPSKLTSCFQKNASKYNESHSETPSSLHLNAKKGEGCVDDHNHADVRIITNDKSKHQNGSSPCTNDLLEHPNSFQVTDSPSTSKCTDTTSDLSENSRGSKGQNENKDLNCTPEITIKSPKNPVPVHKNYGNTNGSANDEHGKQVKLCTNQDQIEVDCLSDTNNSVSSTLNPQISTDPVTHLMDNLTTISKQEKKLSKKRQVRSLRSNKIVNEINHSPVASKLLDSGSQNETPFCSFSESLSSPYCELPKSKFAQNSKNLNSEISSLNNPPFRKRGRPKSNKPGLQFETNIPQVSAINPPSDENAEDLEQELDIVQTRPMERKRGRPKQSFSIQAQETQSKLSSKKQCSGDLHTTSKDKARNIQKCKKSKRVIMKTIIGKINKMKVKRKDQMLTQILLGQKQCDSRDISYQGTERDACSPDSTATHSLSSLVSSFGGKLGSQINVSKRGTIYMGKRRGRKPKCQTTSNISFQKSPQMLSDNPHFTPMSTFVPSLDSQNISLSGSHNTLKNIASSSSSGRCSQISFNAPKIKATSFKQLSENSQAHGELTLMCDSGEGINDNTTSDRSKRNNRLDEGMGFCSAPATGPVFTSGVPGSNSFHGRQRALCALPPERLFSAHLPLGSGRPQDSNPSLTFTDQEAHKFKCHRKGHHCLSREKLRRHKYKCKKKYMHLKAKHQDPDFLADIDDLVVRLSKIRIVQRITRPKLGDDGNIIGRKTVKGKCQSYDLQCLQEKVHPQAMFQINLSGYYSPHSALSCEPLHYVRMANMRRKHGCVSEPSEQIVTHLPVMHKLGYPYPGGGYIHPSYKVPVTTASLGFGLCRGYPSSTLYPLPFPPSYLHHFSKNPIISPSKFHKKRTKFPRQDSAIWGQSAHGTYPRMTPHSSCDCFNTESGQRQRQKEKGKGRRDKHSMTERQHGNEEWLNKHTKANEISGNCSFNSPSPSLSPIFSPIQQKDKTFPFTRLNPSNLGQGGEVRRSEHQPPWGIGSRSLNHPFETLENNSVGHENTLKGPETEGNSTSAQQLHRRTQSFLKQPTLINGTPSQKRLTKSRRSEGLTGVSSVLREQAKTSVQALSSGDMRTAGINQAGGFPKKHQCSDPSLSREPEKMPRGPTGFKTKRRPLIKNKSNYARQTSSFLRDEQSHPEDRNTPSTSSAKVQHFKASKHHNSEGLEFTDGNGVKRRGPGRPRKTPKPSSPSSPSSLSCPELASSLSIEKAGEDDKDNSDTVLEIIELVIQGEQRSGKKRKQDESVGDGEQNQNEEKDETEHSSTLCHMCSEPIDPSPSQVEDSEPEQVTASLPNKKYLWAGLYSDVYKTEDIPDQPHQLNLEGLEYNPEEHEYGLFPAPLHVGKYLRVKRINFQLPYDIHWQYARNKLFEKPVTLPQASPSNSSCNPPNSSAPQSCSDDCFNTMLSDDETQSCDMDNHTHVYEEHHQCHHHLKQQEETSDNENFPTTLSSEERSFVMKHGVFLVRNYEKMKARQAFLLREGAREQEKEKDEDKANGQQSEGRSLGEDPTIKSDRCPIDRSSCAEEGEHITFQSRNLSHTLQEIWDRIVTCKGSSGQTLSDPLLNLCSRKRSDSALVDLSVVQKQLQSGCYESLAAFHSDMLTVFHCAEKYYGSESAVGRDVSQLRGLYHRAHQEASAHISNFLALLDGMLAEKKIKTQRSIFIQKGWTFHRGEKDC